MLWANFLEQIPPGSTQDIEDLFKNEAREINSSDIQLHCDSDKCKGVRFFNPIHTPTIKQKYSEDVFITYWCRNCQYSTKLFSLRILNPAGTKGTAMKHGELPFFGPPLPSRVISLVGPDRELFLRGRRCENQGLGIGAFAYYRRVVENQKGRLINEISKVATRLGASAQTIQAFERAGKETRFSRAIDDIKAAIPASLLIDTHNPLVLLHSALSEGIHAATEEDCLKWAMSIRVVLTELADRISIALKDDAELKQAISDLLRAGREEARQHTNQSLNEDTGSV
jgi:hypothetical protein